MCVHVRNYYKTQGITSTCRKYVGMVGLIKKYTNKSSKDNNRQNAPHILFSSNRVSRKT